MSTTHHEDVLFDVSASAFKVASTFMAKQDIRYYLNGVLVQPHPEGVVMVGSNGHCMVAIIDRTGYVKKPLICTIPKDVRKALPRRAVHDDGASHRLRLTDVPAAKMQAMHLLDKNQVVLASASESLLVDGKFPDWERIMRTAPKTLTPMSGKANLHYYARLAKGFEKGGFLPFISYQHAGEVVGSFGPIFIAIVDAPEVIACIMPMQTDAAEMQQTEWRDKWAAATAEPVVATASQPGAVA